MKLPFFPILSKTVYSFLFLVSVYAADDEYKLIFIGNVTHQNNFGIEVPPGTTVKQLKEMIEEHEEVPVNQQRLYKYNFVEGCCLPKTVRIELNDDQLCSSYDFRRYEVLALHGDNTKKLYITDMLREQGFSIKFLDDMTISQVKLLIQKHINIPVAIQRLQKSERVSGGLFPKYRSITLEDDKPCSFYKFGRYEQVMLTRVNASVSDVHRPCPE